MPFPDADCFEVKNAKFPLDLALAFPNANALIRNLKNGGSKLTHYGNIIADIFFLLSHFSKANIYFVRRQCNQLAHSLARRAIIPPSMSV